MRSKSSTYTITIIFTVVATLMLCVLRTMALLVEFDPVTSYYNHDAVLPSIYMCGTFLIVIAVAAVVFYMRSELRSVAVTSGSSALIFVSALFGFVIVAGTLLDFFAIAGDMSVLSKIALAFAIPAALYCLIGTSLPIGSRAAETVLSMLFIIWLFFTLVSIYFDTAVEVNNPNKVMTMATLAVSLIFFVSEARFRVYAPRPCLFVFSGLVTLIFSGLYSVPNALLLILRLYPDENISVTRELILLCIFAYTLARLIATAPTVGLPVEEPEEPDETVEGGDESDGAPSGERKKERRRRRLSEYDMYDDEYDEIQSNDKNDNY